jgi:heme exporter protein C
MTMSSRIAIWTCGALTLGVTGLALAAVGANGGGDVSRLLFVHLPSAAVTFLACGLVFVAGVGHLYQRRPWWDRLASAAGLVAVAACSVLLVTGMMWGKLAWGQWWMWTPRLTFSLVLWLLYAGLLVCRPFVPPERRATVSAVYGIVAFLDVPLVYMSVKLLPDLHPASVTLDGGMKRTLLWCIAAAVLGAAWFVLGKVKSERASERESGRVPLAGAPRVV